MATIRRSSKSNYKAFSTLWLQDETLSFGARWLYAYLLSLPDDWNIVVEDLITRSPEGKYAINWYMKELINCWYLEKWKRQRRENWWLWSYDYSLHEESKNWYNYINEERTRAWSQKSYIWKSYVGKTYVGKSANSNNTSIVIKDSNINKDIDNSISIEDIDINKLDNLELFIYTQSKNITGVAFQIEKKWRINYIASQRSFYEKLLKNINEKQASYIMNWIINDDFWKNQIWSIEKLLKKNKDWIPYYIYIIWVIKSKSQKQDSKIAFIPWI